MGDTTFRDKREIRTFILMFLIDGPMVGVLIAVMFNFNMLIVVGISVIAWIIFIIWAFLDWYYIDREAREKNRFIISPGNEDYLTDLELEMYNGVGLADYEYEQVKIQPNRILSILQDPTMSEETFKKLKRKLKYSKIHDESKVKLIVPDADDKDEKQEKDEHEFALNFPKHQVDFSDFKIEDLDKKLGRFPRLDTDVIQWIKVNHGVHTIEDLRKQNAVDLNREIRSRFLRLKVDGFNLEQEIQYAIDDITQWTGRVIFKLTQQNRVKFIKLREMPLFMLYYDYYIYKVKFDREIPTIYKNKDGEVKRTFSDEVYMILPQSWNDSFKFTSREIPFKGYYPTCPDVAQIEWVFREFILKDMPVYLVNSCYYTRQRIQKNLTIDNDEVLIASLQIMGELYLDVKKENEKEKMFNRELQNQLTVDQGQGTYSKAVMLSKLANIKELRKGINFSMKPTKTIYMFKWVIVVIMVIIGISMFFGGMYFGYSNAQNQLIETVIP